MVPKHDLNDLSVTIYAPAWTWQKRDINILIVLENSGAESIGASLALILPEGLEDHFEYLAEQDTTLSIAPGETVRHAFTNIKALDGVPRQEYVFTLAIQSGEQSITIPYPVKTIRGAVVDPGKWAALLPAGLAALWCIVFIVVMARFAERGAWKTPSAPFSVSDDAESWIHREP